MKRGTFKTRHALLLSLLSLTTCFAMLLGTTFAWFTDSVTSGVNKIIAGNLDVELDHQEMVNGAFNGTDSKVDPTTELFKIPATATSPMLWEPGARAVEKFVVKNVGNLAFKYNMNLAVAGFNTVSGTKSLKDVIKVAVTDTAPGANDALTWQDLSAFSATGNMAASAADKEFYVTLYWVPNDNDVDNIYNLNNGRLADDGSNKLTIDLGVTLVATQDTVEYDSFSNTYDAAATYPTTPITASASAAVTYDSNTNLPNAVNLNAGAATATVPANTTYTDANSNAIAAPTTLKLEVEPAAQTTADFAVDVGTVDYYDISLLATNATETTEVKTTSNIIPVTLNIGTGLSNVHVNHAGTAMTADTTSAADTFTYDATTGILTLYLNSFSPFAIGYDAPVAAIGKTKYPTLVDAVNAVPDDGIPRTIKLLRDAKGAGIGLFRNDATYRATKKNMTIDFDGHTYTCIGPAVGSTGTQTQAFHLEQGNTVVLKNGTVNTEAGKGILMLIQNYCNLTLKNMVADFSAVNRNYALSNNCGTVVIEDSTITVQSGKVAFDVCRYSSYPSVSVELKGNSVINGNIEIDVGSNDPKDGLTLKLTAGTVNGELKPLSTLTNALNGSNADKVSITKAADFAIDAPSGFTWTDNTTLALEGNIA